MPKERIKQANFGRKDRPSGLADRAQVSNGQIRDHRGDTRIDTLRQTYGDNFAAGVRGDAQLKTLLKRTGSNTLSDYLKANGPLTASQKDKENGLKGGAFNIRYASDERFSEVHRKTSTLHADLFRRLAE